MKTHIRQMIMGATVAAAASVIFGGLADAQPNPYREVENWVKLPDGRSLGEVSSVTVDPGGNVWALERCGTYLCAGSNLSPILKFDPSGKLLKSFGAGMFVFPHGFYADRDGNIWVTDAQGGWLTGAQLNPKRVAGMQENKGSETDARVKGHQVFKFSPEGKLLLTLGKAGIAGDGPDTFNAPTGVVVAPNGDIFVADGHGGDTNARIVRFSKDGKFIKAWGKKGSGPGEFGQLHAIAMDSRGRVFVGDRGNNRIQIFDQNGKLLEEWKQFGRPGSIFIAADDTIYVTDHQSEDKAPNAGFETGIRIGSARDGLVTAFIPSTVAETVAADGLGNVYAGDTSTRSLRKFVKK